MENLFIPVDDHMYATLKLFEENFPFILSHDDLNNYSRGFVNWHKQKTIEISCVLEGSVKVCLLKEEHIVPAGSAFVIFQERLHSIQPMENQSGKYFTAIFDPILINGFPGSYFEQQFYQPLLSSPTGYYSFAQDPALETFFSEMHWLCDHFQKDNSEQYLEIQQRMQRIWASMAQYILGSDLHQADSPGEKSDQDTRILQMITWLRDHYSDRFSLSDMAESLHISRGECCRFFKKMIGMTISDYLLEYRLGKATELLTSTDSSITEIAHSVGFNSASNFSALFRKKTGCTPGQYRKAAAR